MSAFDAWIVGFEPGEAPPAERLQAAFGLDLASARALEQAVPKIVKHAIPAKAAGEMRQALESIGAVVECRPARDPKPANKADAPAVFRPPDADLLPPDRVSAIDPFAPPADKSVPRISIEDPIPPMPRPKVSPPVGDDQPRRITASLLETSHAQQRRAFLRQAVGTLVAGVAILAIGWFFGSSVLRGEADWIGIGFDGIGIYFVGVGLYDFITTLRS